MLQASSGLSRPLRANQTSPGSDLLSDGGLIFMSILLFFLVLVMASHIRSWLHENA